MLMLKYAYKINTLILFFYIFIVYMGKVGTTYSNQTKKARGKSKSLKRTYKRKPKLVKKRRTRRTRKTKKNTKKRKMKGGGGFFSSRKNKVAEAKRKAEAAAEAAAKAEAEAAAKAEAEAAAKAEAETEPEVKQELGWKKPNYYTTEWREQLNEDIHQDFDQAEKSGLNQLQGYLY